MDLGATLGQLKSESIAAEDANAIGPVIVPAGSVLTLDCAMICTRAVLLAVSYSITAPPDSVGATPPLKTNLLGSEIVPACLTSSFPGISSYQRTTLPPPPAIVCCVQTASAPPALGSAAATACVRRLSSESSLSVLPGWGTFGGSLNSDTDGAPSAFSSGFSAVPATCQIMRWLPFPENRVASSAAKTKPLGDASATAAGSGVVAMWLSTDVLKGSSFDPNVVSLGASGQA